MKILALMILGLLVVGCGKEVSFTEKDIVGIYEYEVVDGAKARRKSREDGGGYTSPMKKIKIYFREDGSTLSLHTPKDTRGKLYKYSADWRWKIVGKEVHVLVESTPGQPRLEGLRFKKTKITEVYKRFLDGHSSIDGHLTKIATIKDGTREDIPKEGRRLLIKTGYIDKD